MGRIIMAETTKEQDRIEFETHYKKWNFNTYASSDLNKILSDSDFQAIIDMGFRAIPFIYEIISKKDDLIALAVPDIVGHLIGEPSYSAKEVVDNIKKYIEENNLI